jgi:PucR C-terminal helix-turn-helix domain/GGDEF-like domain
MTPTATSSGVRAIAQWMEENLDGLVASLVDRMIEEVPEYFESSDPAVVQLALESTRGNLIAIAQGLESGRVAPEMPPASAIDEAILTAQSRISWTAVARTYWIGHRELWDRISMHVAAGEYSAPEQLQILRAISRYVLTYHDYVISTLAGVYEAERDRALRRGERRRLALIHEILAGGEADEDQLGYRLSVEHIAAVAWGSAPESVLGELAQRWQLPLLVAPGRGGTVWGWFGGKPTAAVSTDMLRAAASPVGTCIAFGGKSRGPEGFRVSHKESLEAQRVGRRSGRPVTCYSDVAIEAFALRDEELARAFVERELGPLSDPNEKSARLRDTLHAYFVAGNNGTAAAAVLGIHERTVSYRLASAEKLLGASTAGRHVELAIALRLYTLLRGEDPHEHRH